jgi:hypothetical protein
MRANRAQTERGTPVQDPITPLFNEQPLAVRLLHLEGINVTYRREPSGLMKLVSATVLVNGACWPLDTEQATVATFWGSKVTDLPVDEIILTPVPGDTPEAPSSQPFDDVPRLRRLGEPDATD